MTKATLGVACLSVLFAGVALAGPDSTSVSRSIPGSSLLVDYTGDCHVTDTDVGVAALLQLSLSSIGDEDADGQITISDKIIALQELILKSYGDVNGDGVIDISDMAQAVRDVQSSADGLSSDANTDGQVDAIDVLYIASSLGGGVPSEGRLSTVANALYRVMSQIEAEGGINTFISSETCVAGDDPCANDLGPESHRVTISDSWYVPAGNHTRAVSAKWPANHSYALSKSWDMYEHQVQLSKETQWPANHDGKFSRTWSRRPNDGWDHDHDLALSLAHPQEHSVDRSKLWSYAPGHLYSRSQTWPTDPMEHEVHASWTWPPNHIYDISRDGGVSSHQYEFSRHDWPGNHAVNRSQDWPPSHTYRVSQTWAPGHSDPWSFRWPPTHQALVSSTWNPDSYPIGWPPNHAQACSDQQNEPGPWDQFWPQNHTRWDSMRDILDLVPPLLPDQWWPLGN
ncbi:MAG: hypothetical protein KJZ65_06085 [Phycisphaerales bacterium]|nr:hypothetical protein [Phycisphaerales bacterium]